MIQVKRYLAVYVLAIICLFSITVNAQEPYSQRMTHTVMTLWKDSLPTGNKWNYDQGVILKGVEGVWRQTGNGEYFKYMKECMDNFVQADGTIRTYNFNDLTLDNILCGRNLLTLYEVTGEGKYLKAVQTLRDQLRHQPRTYEGGFWHKKAYPNQMWLDGLYMAEPFYAEYARVFHDDTAFNDIAKQFELINSHSRDFKTGLIYHGWDASHNERWANPQTGDSPNFWGRAMGWYGMALVDVLEQMPTNHPKYKVLVNILNDYCAALAKYQDKSSGLWYEVMDKAHEKGNYLEASASCMFVYTLAKAARENYVPVRYLITAHKGYNGIVKKFIRTDANGLLALDGTVKVGGLGGTPYRDGSFAYYLREKVITDDAKGVGAFILASIEMERLQHRNAANGKTVLLDSYFNDEHKKDVTGRIISYHYKWDENDSGGYSFLGWIFNNYGFKTQTLYTAPNKVNLQKASVYIITDPDIPKENPEAKYVLSTHIKAITEWVKKGGVLLIMNNDTGNAEFIHLNKLMGNFGMRFNQNSINRVKGLNFEQGAIPVATGNSIFKTTKLVYIKELSTLALIPPAKPCLKKGNDIIVAVCHYGKGTVFAVGDPWFYNEYTDGRKLPPKYQNYNAANDLVCWLTLQAAHKK